MRQPVPDDKKLSVELVEIRRRLSELEGARATRATVQSGGTYKLTNEDGHEILAFGEAGFDPQDNPIYGLRLLDSEDAIVFAVTEDHQGILWPHEYHQWIVPTAQTITSTSFVTVAECTVIGPNVDMLSASGAVIVPVGSTAEIRINAQGVGATDPIVVPSGGNGLASFNWIHPLETAWGEQNVGAVSALFSWEARLASGAGPITVYPPRHLTFRNRIFASSASTSGGGAFT